MFKRILVPLNGSRFSSRALKYADEVAKRFDAEIILMQAVKPAIPILTTTDIAPGIESPATAELTVKAALSEDRRHIARARQYLSRKARETRSKGIKVSYQVVTGDPAGSIVELVRKKHVDLVVMTTHGRSGLKRAIQGSVVDTVIRGSDKPVLVTKGEARRKK